MIIRNFKDLADWNNRTNMPIPLTPEEIEAKQLAIKNKRYAYTAVSHSDGGWTLGIAMEGIAGYTPTNYRAVKTYDEAMDWAESCNERLGISKEEAFKIVANTMRRR